MAGGLPTAVWGLSAETAARYLTANADRGSGHSGMGTTLSANPLQFAALVANLVLAGYIAVACLEDDGTKARVAEKKSQ